MFLEKSHTLTTPITIKMVEDEASKNPIVQVADKYFSRNNDPITSQERVPILLKSTKDAVLKFKKNINY